MTLFLILIGLDFAARHYGLIHVFCCCCYNIVEIGLCYIYVFLIKTKRVQSDFQGTVSFLYGAETRTFIDFKDIILEIY